MSCWDVVVEPRAGHRLLAAAAVTHTAAAWVPWLAGCDVTLAAVLSSAALASLLPTLRCIPGPWSRIRSLRVDADGWKASLTDGRTVAVTVGKATRVYRDTVVIRVASGLPGASWVVTRGSVDRESFRRFKVRLRASRNGRGGADPAATIP